VGLSVLSLFAASSVLKTLIYQPRSSGFKMWALFI